MEKLFLIIILVLLLTIVVIIHFIRLIFRFSHPYSAPMLPARGSDMSERNGGGGTAFLIGCLLLGLAYLFLSEQHSTGATVREPPPEEIRAPGDSGYEEPELDFGSERPVSKTPAPVSVHEVNEFLDRPADEWEIDRYNQAPGHALPAFCHVIQIAAFSNEENAKSEAARISLEIKNLHLIFVQGEVPFKLVVGPFSNRDSARKYQDLWDVDGFIYSIDRR